MSDAYSPVANEQLDQLERADLKLYDEVVDVCEFVLDQPSRARACSLAMTTLEGIRYRLPVPGRYPLCVFWAPEGPRIEAVFPYSR